MKLRRTQHQGRPSLYADDYLEPGERSYFGDEEASRLANDRHLHRIRTSPQRPEITEDDVTPTRPVVVERDDADHRELTAYRRAMLSGRALPFKDAGGQR